MDESTGIVNKGYVLSNLGMASAEVISKFGHDYALDITKNAIKSYINLFFSSTEGRAVLEAISPDAIQFFTDKSFKDRDDHDKIEVQLASFYEEIKEKLPCILLIDSGCIFVNPGLNSLVNTTRIENDLHYTYRIIREVPLTIALGAGDETTTGKLVALLQFLFGDFRSFLGGDRLTSENPQDHWCITLPRIVKSENITSQELPGGSADPKDRIWRGVVNFPNPFIFEDIIYLKEALPKTEIHNPVDEMKGIEIDFPDSLVINEPCRVKINHWNPLDHQITITDYRVASYNPETKAIVARTFGTFSIRVVSRKEIDIKERTPLILAEKEIKVIP